MTAEADAGDWAGFRPVAGHVLGEQSVIGTCLIWPETADELTAIVAPGQFFDPKNQIVFGVIASLTEAAIPVDPSSVLAALTEQGTLASVNGGPYLHTCMQAANRASAAWHARRIVTDAGRRSLHAAGQRIVQYTAQPDFDHDTGFDQACSWVADAVAAPGDDRDSLGVSDIFQAVLTAMDDDTPVGLTTGWADLDRVLVGLAPGTLTVVAARPSTGKSVVGLCLAVHAAGTLGVRTLFGSLEMRSTELGLRMMAAEARVPLSLLRANEVTDPRHWARIEESARRLADAPLVVNDNPVRSLAHVRAQLRLMARTSPAGLYVGDYLTLYQPPKAENRQLEVAALARGFKLLAREFGIPFVILAQLNRRSVEHGGRPPIMSDLRESGEIEQAADNIILLHRPEMQQDESPRAGEIDLIVAKNRQGETGTVTLAWQGQYARCMDMAAESRCPSALRNAS